MEERWGSGGVPSCFLAVSTSLAHPSNSKVGNVCVCWGFSIFRWGEWAEGVKALASEIAPLWLRGRGWRPWLYVYYAPHKRAVCLGTAPEYCFSVYCPTLYQTKGICQPPCQSQTLNPLIRHSKANPGQICGGSGCLVDSLLWLLLIKYAYFLRG